MTDSLAFILADGTRLFRRTFERRARVLGVTGQQWRLLAILSRNPGCNQGSAAELLEVDPITLSRMVDKLQDAQLIERRADPCDRRAWLLHLKDAAIPLIEQMRVLADELLESALEGMSRDERDSFTRLAERFRANLARKDDDDDRSVEPRHARAG